MGRRREKMKGEKMTNEEIEKYNKRLSELSKICASGEPIKDWNKRYNDLKKNYLEVESLAVELGVLLIGANYMNLVNSGKEIFERVAKVESYIAELFNNIRNALQTEMMLNACVSAEESSKLTEQACNSAKWSCRWAALAAIVSLGSIIVMLCSN